MPEFELNTLNDVVQISQLETDVLNYEEENKFTKNKKEEIFLQSAFISKYATLGKYIIILLLFASVLTNIIETNNFINKLCQMYSNLNKTLPNYLFCFYFVFFLRNSFCFLSINLFHNEGEKNQK